MMMQNFIAQRLCAFRGVSNCSFNPRKFINKTTSIPLKSFSSSPLSHVVGLTHKDDPSVPPLQQETIHGSLLSQAKIFGSRELLSFHHQGVHRSWEAFVHDVHRVAGGLLSLGYKKGDRIGIWLPNNYEWLLTFFAASAIGLIAVNLNPAYRKPELEHAIRLVGCTGLVITSALKDSNYVQMVRQSVPELSTADPLNIKSSNLPSLKHVFLTNVKDVTDKSGMMDFNELFVLGKKYSDQDIVKLSEKLDQHDPINIQFTSGTTGLPKGATLTHHNILNNAFVTGLRMRLTPADRLCIPVPLYHCFGLVLGVLACMTHGAKMVFPSAMFDPKAVLEAVAEERCTALHGVPTMFISELSHHDFKTFDLSSLRTGVMAGALCPRHLMLEVMQTMHLKEITIGYGMTETSPISFQTLSSDSLQKRTETVGSIHPYVEAKVVDTNRTTLPKNTPGELMIKGYLVMRGYWNNPEKTRESIDEEGWMATGDLAVIDDDGYCSIVGRLKDCIIRGGENIFPKEVEDVLYYLEKIEDVQIIGVPDKKFGEQVCAWIKLKENQTATEEEVRNFCRDKMAHYKIPKYVIFVDSFPMTVTGKVQKFVMREKSIEMLNLHPHLLPIKK